MDYSKTAMKKVLLITLLVFGAVALIGSPSLGWSCVDGGYQVCNPGRVTFSGNGYQAVVHINVTRNSDHTVYDDFDYDASGGSLSFTETLVPADTYTVTITQTGTALTTSVTTGSSGNDN